MINLPTFIQSAFADIPDDGGDISENAPASLASLADYVGRIINIVIVVALIALVLMIVIGGFQYIFASGDPKSTAEARNRITWAFVGLVMVIIAWFLLLLVKEFTGIDVTTFNIVIP